MENNKSSATSFKVLVNLAFEYSLEHQSSEFALLPRHIN